MRDWLPCKSVKPVNFRNGSKIGTWKRLSRNIVMSRIFMVSFPATRSRFAKRRSFSTAAKKTLELRGDVGTGWSLAWKINLWARLLDGEHAYLLLQKALTPVNSRLHSSAGNRCES